MVELMLAWLSQSRAWATKPGQTSELSAGHSTSLPRFVFGTFTLFRVDLNPSRLACPSIMTMQS